MLERQSQALSQYMERGPNRRKGTEALLAISMDPARFSGEAGPVDGSKALHFAWSLFFR